MGEAEPARSTARTDLLWLLAVLSVIVAYLPFLREIVHLWRVDPYAGHGMFVPLYSAFLLWADRHRLGVVPRRRTPGGALVVMGALALLAAGQWLATITLQGLSLVAAVAGLALWAHGARRLRAAAFPLAFLLFMMPLPHSIVGAFTLDLQAFAATSRARCSRSWAFRTTNMGSPSSCPASRSRLRRAATASGS